MATEKGAAVRTDATGEELDELLTALADWRRRIVVEELAGGGSVGVETLAERVASADDRLTAGEAEIALVHDQLPRLDEAGIVRYDAAARRCELRPTIRAATLERVLRAVREAI